MYLDESRFPGGGGEPTCRACKEPILGGQRTTRVDFLTDSDGVEGLTGDYHAGCARPYTSLARAINMLSRFGR